MAVILLVSSSWLQSLNKTFLTTADQPRFPHGYVPACSCEEPESRIASLRGNQRQGGHESRLPGCDPL